MREVALRARRAAHAAITRGEPIADREGGVFDLRCGVFVTLRRRGELAGCIGYIEPIAPLGELVVKAATSAAIEDDRFEPWTEADCATMSVEISLLSALVESDAASFRPGIDGLVLRHPRAQGLLLPQVAIEHELDREQFLAALVRKAGLTGTRIPEDAALFAFTVRSFTLEPEEESRGA